MKSLRFTASSLLLGLGALACAPLSPSSNPPQPATAPTPATQPGATASGELIFPVSEAFRGPVVQPGQVGTPPPAGAPRPLQPPSIERFSLANGVEVYLVERHELPVVALDLIFEGGSMSDPRGEEGLASQCFALLSEGTEKLDTIAYNEALADIASGISSFAAFDQQGLGLATLSRNLDTTLDLWVDTMLHPGMRKADLDRMVRSGLDGLKQQKGSPAGLAGRLSSTVIYGEGHRLGRPVTEKSLKSVTVQKCKRYTTDSLKPQGAKLYAVGDITRSQLEEKVGGRLSKWTGTPKRAAAVPEPKPRSGKIFFVDVPGAPQSVVSLLHLGPPRTAPDFFPTSLMSGILGGSFSSRINLNIREDKGWAYGASGGFAYRRSHSIFSAGGSIKSEHTVDSVRELLKEIRGIQAAEVSDEELAREKEGTVLSLPAQFATGQDVLGSFRNLVYYGLPLDYYAQYVPQVQAVTKQAVQQAAKAHLRPDDVLIFVVGDAKTVLPGLQQLLAEKAVSGELVRLDPDGKVIPGKPVQSQG